MEKGINQKRVRKKVEKLTEEARAIVEFFKTQGWKFKKSWGIQAQECLEFSRTVPCLTTQGSKDTERLEVVLHYYE